MHTAQLNNLELHDREIDSLFIDFANKKIEIIINTAEEDILHLIFWGIKNIEMPGFNIEDCELMEVYSHTVDAAYDGYYRIIFTLLLGFGKPCAFLQFLFQSCSLNGKILAD